MVLTYFNLKLLAKFTFTKIIAFFGLGFQVSNSFGEDRQNESFAEKLHRDLLSYLLPFPQKGIILHYNFFWTSEPQKSASDSSNFDSDFTAERAQLTPTDSALLKTMNQHVFKHFSFTSQDALRSWSVLRLG